MQDVFGGRLTAFVHNAGLYVNLTTSSAEAPANLKPDEDWNDRIYGTALDAFIIQHMLSASVRGHFDNGGAFVLDDLYMYERTHLPAACGCGRSRSAISVSYEQYVSASSSLSTSSMACLTSSSAGSCHVWYLDACTRMMQVLILSVKDLIDSACQGAQGSSSPR